MSTIAVLMVTTLVVYSSWGFLQSGRIKGRFWCCFGGRMGCLPPQNRVRKYPFLGLCSEGFTVSFHGQF